MDVEGFWALIERSGRERDTLDGREQWLIGELRKLGGTQIEDFAIRLQECRDRVDNAAMWAAVDVVYGGASTDTFWYFQCWLIGQGREAFEEIAAAPDALAGLPSIRRLAGRTFHDWAEEEWPWWESLAYVPGQAHPGDLEKALAARGFRTRSDPFPPDWSQIGEYPALRELFPASGG
ncbi:DUF4240 domain-containing protein [Actinoplanes regularis]|uniref:DUF4240 domain-containing protein n=1 Tax=Actinoplanes regularis TaxID=52697 RepID=A0A238ZG46_9ACTN|nr:DUF4240 domain-containing protein [Actinoplanes regularis]GIE87715.1 hypothetical protein Are01nite_41950 [Actinoplanes regularis]SNR82476.1 Protein of unknown function [Actinoplanes regularis]